MQIFLKHNLVFRINLQCLSKLSIANVSILLLVTIAPISSQEIEEVKPIPKLEKKEISSKNPKIAALLGVIPGVGQAYVGNNYTAAGQALTFLGLYNTERHFRRQPDYIKYTDREVKFDFNDAVIGYEFQKNGWVRQPPCNQHSRRNSCRRLFSVS
jgi:hypothetical protein